MGQAIPLRTDNTAGEVRRFAQRAKDAAQARRLLAIAAVLDGASREEAATIGGMDRQTLRDAPSAKSFLLNRAKWETVSGRFGGYLIQGAGTRGLSRAGANGG